MAIREKPVKVSVNHALKKFKIWITVLALKLLHMLMSGKTFKINNARVEVCKNVFSPVFTLSSSLLAKVSTIEVRSNDIVLDLGTGSGVLSLILARKSFFTVASDISLDAARCALKNLKKNSLNAFCDVVACDLTSAFREKAFSLVVFNPPYLEGKAKNALEKAWIDDSQTAKRFFLDSKRVLKKYGRILLVYSDLGPLDQLLVEATKENWWFAKMTERRTLWETLAVFKFTRPSKD